MSAAVCRGGVMSLVELLELLEPLVVPGTFTGEHSATTGESRPRRDGEQLGGTGESCQRRDRGKATVLEIRLPGNDGKQSKLFMNQES